MSKLSERGAGSRDDEIEALSILINGVNTSLVGMTTYFPPTSKDGSVDPSWIMYGGQTIARAAAPALWERAKQLDVVVSDAAWLALKAASPNGAVAVYSSGDGSTTMRMPTTGDDGGFMRSVGTDPVLNALRDFKKGFQDQMQDHSHAWERTLLWNTSIGGNAFFGSNGIGNSAVVDISTDGVLDARAGNETHPKGMYGKLYVYAGNVTTKLPVPTPDWLAQQTANTQKIAELEPFIGVDCVIESKKTDKGWYRKHKSGFIEQGGSLRKVGNGLAEHFEYPIPFTDVNTIVLGGDVVNATSSARACLGLGLAGQERTHIRVALTNWDGTAHTATTQPIYWEAKGY
ncbi:hypothetical protein [Vibrio europaeus]|uniref:hypothetical protein n=1 Tax=Vibrio europaeus TaxID=300876 RepID=UPI00233E9C55|nr:hypothetical protein [Vibrio europaeus]MDC5753524.1 hypothetical protein [Vibrio europaeus]MDC5816563.1 hypothetical protein [Vibrio europaeus]